MKVSLYGDFDRTTTDRLLGCVADGFDVVNTIRGTDERARVILV